MKQEEEQKKNNAQPVSDDELEAVTGGAAAQILASAYIACRYCHEQYSTDSINTHEKYCSKNPDFKK